MCDNDTLHSDLQQIGGKVDKLAAHLRTIEARLDGHINGAADRSETMQRAIETRLLHFVEGVRADAVTQQQLADTEEKFDRKLATARAAMLSGVKDALAPLETQMATIAHSHTAFMETLTARDAQLANMETDVNILQERTGVNRDEIGRVTGDFNLLQRDVNANGAQISTLTTSIDKLVDNLNPVVQWVNGRQRIERGLAAFLTSRAGAAVIAAGITTFISTTTDIVPIVSEVLNLLF